jgi:ribonuclease HI
MSFSFGEISVLMTRMLLHWQNQAIVAGHGYNSHLPLSSEARSELSFWRTSFERFDGRRPLWLPSHLHTIKVFSDAAGAASSSFGGWGGWADLKGQRLLSSGRWNFDTRGVSSAYIELRAIHNVMLSLNREGLLHGQRVLVHTDSQVSDAVLKKGGSTKLDLQRACYDIMWYCIEQKISLVSTWIPRNWNTVADALSKGEESCDWMLNPHYFRDIANAWGPFAVDLFASATNHQFRPYFSWFHTPTCAGVNAFAFDWPSTSWCNPPFAVIGRVIRHASNCRTRMALIVPFWPMSAWWHLLIENEYVFQPFVWACAKLPKVPDLFLGGAYGNTRPAFAPGWETLALLLDFSKSCPCAIQVPNL